MIDFSSDINFYQPDFQLSLSGKSIAHNSKSDLLAFKELLAKKYSLKSEQIALFSGRESSIYKLLKKIKEESVFLFAPLESIYEKATLKSKKNVYKINRLSDSNQEVLEESIVIFSNPSMPEGVYEEDILVLLKEWMDLECTIIIDESFIEFTEFPSTRDEINRYKKLYVIHSFSQFYSCVGVSLSAIFSHKKNIKKIQDSSSNISALDRAFLQERLMDENFTRETKKLQAVQKTELTNILTSSKLFTEIVESDTNTILTYSSNAQEIFEYLLEHKIQVYQCQEYDYLNEKWLRFSVQEESQQEKLAEILDSFSV